MSKTLSSKRHAALVAILIRERERADMTQAEVARRLKEHQSFVARVESGQRRIDIVEFFQLAEVIGFDPKKAISHLQSVK